MIMIHQPLGYAVVNSLHWNKQILSQYKDAASNWHVIAYLELHLKIALSSPDIINK